LGPKTRSLIEVLEAMASLLRNHGELRWASALEQDLEWIRDGDFHGVTHFLSAFGGMGTLSDLVLSTANGHDIELDDHARVNEALSALRSRAWDLADRISREATVVER